MCVWLRIGHLPNQSPSNSGDRPTTELPTTARGLSTPEALAVVLRHAQRLLSGHTVAALSVRTGSDSCVVAFCYVLLILPFMRSFLVSHPEERLLS